MASRNKLKPGDLVKHHAKLHPDFGKIGMITRLAAGQRAMRIALVMCEGAERVWFIGDFRKVREEDDEST